MSSVSDAPIFQYRPPRRWRLFQYRPARRWRRSTWVGFVGALSVVATLALTGGAAGAPAWSVVPLPGDVAAVTVTAYRDQLLVGTASRSQPGAPRLVRVQGNRRTPLPVTPASGYGAEARWMSMAVDDAGALVAVGEAHGGAHANSRWTVWRGEVNTGLVEEPQTFETFGGWGAGDLVDAVASASGPVLVGSWESRALGHDAAVWLPSGPARWVRQSSAGTALESTWSEVVGAKSATADGSRLLLSGSALRLVGTSARESPVVWRSETGARGWSRLELPSAGRRSGEASGAVCAAGTCTVVGDVDGRLAVWRLTAAAERLDTVPDVGVGGAPRLPEPVAGTSGVLIAVPDRSGFGSRLLHVTGTQLTSLRGPPGKVRALAVVGTVVYAVADDTRAVGTLWAAHL